MALEIGLPRLNQQGYNFLSTGEECRRLYRLSSSGQVKWSSFPSGNCVQPAATCLARPIRAVASRCPIHRARRVRWRVPRWSSARLSLGCAGEVHFRARCGKIEFEFSLHYAYFGRGQYAAYRRPGGEHHGPTWHHIRAVGAVGRRQNVPQ